MSLDGTPIRTRRRAPAARAIALLTAVAVGTAGIAPAHAQDSAMRGMPIIRDAEIEQLLRDYAQPVLRAAGLAKQNVRVVVLSDRSFNAFVMDGRHIFINAGALFDAKTPNEVIGVFAHETGHLAGGHLQRLREQLASAQTASIIALRPALAQQSPAPVPEQVAAMLEWPRSWHRSRRSCARCSPTSARRKIRPITQE